MQIAPGMCASSNCSSVRTSTTQRAVALVLLDLARRERIDLRRRRGQRPAVERDDGAEVRRLRAEPGDRALDELVLVVDAAAASWWARS